MAEKIELQIVADNSQYIAATKQVEQATVSMQNTVGANQKKQKELIDQTANAYKVVVNEKKKAFDTKPIEDHTKKTQASADAIQNMGGAAGGAVGKVKSLSAAFKALLANPIALVITAVVGALAGLVKLFKSTDSGANQLAARFAQLKAILDVIRQRVLSFGAAIGDLFKGNFKAAAEGMKNSFKGVGDQMRNATNAAYDYVLALDAIEDAEKNYVSTAAENRNKIAKLEFTSQDRRKSTEERKKALQDALALGIQEVEAQKEFARQKLDAGIIALAQQNRVTEQELLAYIKMTDAERKTADQALKDLYNRNEDKVNDLDQMYATWLDLDTRYYDENKRNLSRLSGFEEEVNRDAMEKKKKADEERLKNQEEFIKKITKLEEDYAKVQIASLSGEEQIKAQEAFNIAQIDEEEKKLKELGELNEEGIKMLEALRQFAHQQALRDIKQFNAEQLTAWEDTYKEAGNKLLDNLEFRKDIELQTLELSGQATEAKRLEIENKYLAAQRDLYLKAGAMYDPMVANWIQGLIDANEKLIEGSGFNFWDALGISDPEQQEAVKENINIAIDNIAGMLDELYSRRVEDAQRNRELIDEQIGYTTDALNAEIELAKLGYANNVDAKKKELAELEKARTEAIKKEQKAVKAQQQLDTVMQLTSLITASAQILKGTAKDPITLGIAIATIAAMFAAFAATKATAAKATKLAEGGYGDETGVITGRSHAQGGERFTDNIEVERGEMWGVLNRKASQKYGKQFGQMVTSFNKDNLIIESSDVPVNNILVDVNQTNERLDRVQYELIKLNRHFGNNKDIKDFPNMRIEKIGNKTRIIRK